MPAHPNHPQFWETLYQNEQFPWDLNGPTPVFQRLAKNGVFPPGKMIVLGAGRGYDAHLFARYGFAVTAVDFAAEAIQSMQENNDPDYPVEIVQSDFFMLPQEWNGRYQYILDYTCFCAIHPPRRGKYADLVARLLKPSGQYITLVFPIGTRRGGPPYTVQPNDIIELFAERGFVVTHQEARPFDSVPERQKYEELLLLQKSTG
ncbi:MAG: methyltransferase domain-containing protein [Chloroflexi bacterium]|nr:methyltransferase domain-containing protein [Chloroflexota bacterium]